MAEDLAELEDQAIALAELYARTNDRTALEQAARLFRRVLAGTPVDDPDYAVSLLNAAIVMIQLLESGSSGVDLDEVVAHLETAVRLTPSAEVRQRANLLSSHGVACRMRYQVTGHADDLTTAVESGRAAVALGRTPPPDPQLGGYESNLGLALHLRFSFSGHRADLDEAVETLRAATMHATRDDPRRAWYLGNLAMLLVLRHRWTSAATDSGAALAAARQSVAESRAGEPARAVQLDTLAQCLLAEFDRTKDRQLLDQSVARSAEAVGAVGIDAPNGAFLRSNLAAALGRRFELRHRPADLDRAVSVLSGVDEARSSDDPRRATYLTNLAQLLVMRSRRDGSGEDLARAGALFRIAASLATAAPVARVRAARSWGDATVQAGDFAAAADSYGTAVMLLPTVAWRGLSRRSQEFQLAVWSGLAGDAAAACIAVGDGHRALELSDLGRAVIWGQLISPGSELARLDRKHPDVVRRLAELRALLDESDLRSGAAQAI